MGRLKNPQFGKINVTLLTKCVYALIKLLMEFNNVFAKVYKDLNLGTPLKIVEHHIKLDILIALVHQSMYMLNSNYVVIVKQNIEKYWQRNVINLCRKLFGYQ